MMEYYILENKKVKHVPEHIYLTWAKNRKNKMIKRDKYGDVLISTIFLGFDNTCFDLFETMIFGGEYNRYQSRCSSYEEAIEGHDKAVKLVKKGGK